MQINEMIRNLIQVFKVANDDVIGNTARQIFNLNWKEGLSARNQAHKILEELVVTNQIVRGNKFYALRGYQGDYREHGRIVTKIISQLILLRLPITVHREVPFPIGLRADIVTLIGKRGKGLCAVIEVANNETPAYLDQKITAWRNWKDASRYLSEVFNTYIPHFSLVLCGISHPEAIDFEAFLEEVRK
jgi:hypothetical protein